MDDLFTRFFSALYQFHKLHMGDLVPDITKLEGITMAAIKHCSGEKGKEELTVSELTAKLKAKGPAVSRTLKTLEDKGYIERDVNKATAQYLCEADGIRGTEAGRVRADHEQLCACSHLKNRPG